MHVEICTNSRIDLWDLLGSTKGKFHEELIQCLPPKASQGLESLTTPSKEESEMSSAISDAPPNTSLTISNLRNGYHLSASKLPFLWKLHEMLDDVEKTGDDHIVSWMTEGTSFRVHKPKSFVQKIIPFYFNQSKFKSFQRQLHLYEFVRTPRGINAGAYSHPMFIRGKKSLCLSLSPHKIKNKGKVPSSTKDEAQRQAALVSDNSISSEDHSTSFSDETPRKRTRAESETDATPNDKGIDPYCLRSMILSGSAPSEWTLALKHVVLVTGASLAAELEAKKMRTGDKNESETTFTTALPHNGDIVYAFGGKPFRFIEELPEFAGSHTMETCNDDDLDDNDDDLEDALFMDVVAEELEDCMVI